jgi:hypothetical protein
MLGVYCCPFDVESEGGGTWLAIPNAAGWRQLAIQGTHKYGGTLKTTT